MKENKEDSSEHTSKNESGTLPRVDPKDKELSYKLKGKDKFKDFYKEALKRYQYYPKLAAELEKLRKQYDELKQSKVVKTYDFINDKYPNLKCSLCSDLTFGKKVYAQQHEDGSKSYRCEDCHINSGSDKAISKSVLKKKELKRQLKALNNEIDQKTQMLEELNWMDDLKVIKDIAIQMHHYFMENQPLDERIIDYLRKLMRFADDFNLFMEEKFKTKTAKKVLSKPTSFNGANPEKSNAYINRKWDGVNHRPADFDPFRQPFNR